MSLLLAQKILVFSNRGSKKSRGNVDLYKFQPITSDYLVARTKTVEDRIH
jgi:hypothetical protein